MPDSTRCNSLREYRKQPKLTNMYCFNYNITEDDLTQDQIGCCTRNSIGCRRMFASVWWMDSWPLQMDIAISRRRIEFFAPCNHYIPNDRWLVDHVQTQSPSFPHNRADSCCHFYQRIWLVHLLPFVAGSTETHSTGIVQSCWLWEVRELYKLENISNESYIHDGILDETSLKRNEMFVLQYYVLYIVDRQRELW